MGLVWQPTLRLSLTRAWVPYALLLPAVVLMLGLNLVNAAFGVIVSFLDWSYLRPAHMFDFVGLRHYAVILADPVFRDAVLHTLVWCVVVVPGAFLVGLGLALLLNEEVRASALFRGLLLLPWSVPLVVAGVAWSFIFAPNGGLLDDLLSRLGIPDMAYTNWLGRDDLAFPIVMAVQIWRWAPFFSITLLAGLQAIPSDLYEAAEIDGAGAVKRFRFITLPLLRAVAAVVFLQGLIWSFHNFTLVFVMTNGGPAHATEVLTIYLWRQAFSLAEVGRGAAVGTLLVLVISVLGSIWVLRVLGKETEV
jgi:multiple sugar transport system permease protein